MNSGQPPNKRRRLSNNSPQIHSESTNTNSHQTLPLPTHDPSYPQTFQDAESRINHFGDSWTSYINTHLDHDPPINMHFPNSIHSNINTPTSSTSNNNPSKSSPSMTLDSTDYKNDNNNITNHNNNNVMDEIMKLKTENDKLTQENNKVKQENNKLKQDNNNFREEIGIKDKQIREYKQSYTAEIRQKELYQLRLKGLAQMIKTGNSPHFERVNMNKMNLRMSEIIYNIKHKITQYHLNKYKNQTHVNINEVENHAWISKKSLTQIIKNHMSYNDKRKNNPTKPDILMRKQRRRFSNRNINNYYKRKGSSLEVISASQCDYENISWNFILNVFRIPKDSHRIQALNTGYQRGLKTRINLPVGTIIGEYIGIEYTYDEYQSVFNHSNEEAIRNVYAFDCTLNEPINNGFKPVKMILDGYGLRERIMAYNQSNNTNVNIPRKECEYSAHLLYINDCREEISMDKPSEEDSKYWNIDFVSAEVNGIPKVFLITRRDVKADTELMTWYGESYDVALKQQTEYERMRNSMITLVDNSILKGIDLSNDVWTIE